MVNVKQEKKKRSCWSPWSTSPVSKTFRDECPSKKQTADRLSDPPKWHSLVYYDQTIVWEKLLYVVARLHPWIKATKGKKNNTGVGCYTAVMRKIRGILLLSLLYLNAAFQYVQIQGFYLLLCLSSVCLLHITINLSICKYSGGNNHMIK